MIQLYEQDLNTHRRGYMCLSSDIANLPTNPDIELEHEKMYNGCYAYCLDTGDLYMYNAATDQWVLQ